MRMSEIESQVQDFITWYQSPIGQIIREKERDICHEYISQLFGYHVLQIGLIEVNDWLTTSRIHHRIGVQLLQEAKTLFSGVRADLFALPFAEDSIDLVCLPHSLEIITQPKLLLEEVNRILLPEGHLIIIGFNRCSLLGLTQFLFKSKPALPKKQNHLNERLLQYWLMKLGYELTAYQRFFYRLPLNNQAWLQRLAFLEKMGQYCWPMLNGGYIILAKKKVIQPTLVGTVWSKKKVAKNSSQIVEPT